MCGRDRHAGEAAPGQASGAQFSNGVRAVKAKAEISEYSGVERAAVLMLALGEGASQLMPHLHDDEIHEISSAMSRLGPVPAPVVDAVISDFFKRFSGAGFLLGSVEQTEKMLLGVLPPERVSVIMEELRGPAGRSVWDKLGNVSQGVLASYLANEYPQTIAVVLSKVPPNVAASVLAALPHDLAVNAVERMLVMEPVQRDILQQVEGTMRSEFIGNLGRTPKRDNHELMAEVFNSFDRQVEGRFMAQLGAKAHDSVERIKALMFVFDDLARLDGTGVQVLLRSIDKSDLCLAMKGASEAMSQLFFSNMSERGAKLLREEMQSVGPVRAKDVNAAQARIVATAKDLAARNELMLAGQSAEDELIY